MLRGREMGMEKEEVRLVFAPSPHISHFLAMVDLAKLILRRRRHFSVTIIAIPPLHPNQHLSSAISTAATSIPGLSVLELQPVTPPHFPTFLSQTLASLTLDFYAPHVKSAISTLMSTAPVAALVLDFFCIDLIDVAVELGIPPYVFFTSSATIFGFLLHLPRLDSFLPEDMRDMRGKTVTIPGFTSKIPPEAFPDGMVMGKNEIYRWLIHLGRRFVEVKGTLVNSYAGLEPIAIKSLQEDLLDLPTPPVYPIGPILSLKAEPEHECIIWLNEQPGGSVVFLCFGSSGKFPETRVRQIAAGLERSGHRFLWVLRAPLKDGEDKRMVSTDAVLEDLLPAGFVERTKERGLVWPSFAPQAEILAHDAVGGFVTHCGWNSCLESLWFGVPMAAWPLYAEQHLNAFAMVKELSVAVEVRIERWEGNKVSAEEVERAVRALMGEESVAVREKVKEMGEEARKAVAEGGSSYCTLEGVLEQWLRSK